MEPGASPVDPPLLDREVEQNKKMVVYFKLEISKTKKLVKEEFLRQYEYFTRQEKAGLWNFYPNRRETSSDDRYIDEDLDHIMGLWITLVKLIVSPMVKSGEDAEKFSFDKYRQARQDRFFYDHCLWSTHAVQIFKHLHERPANMITGATFGRMILLISILQDIKVLASFMNEIPLRMLRRDSETGLFSDNIRPRHVDYWAGCLVRDRLEEMIRWLHPDDESQLSKKEKDDSALRNGQAYISMVLTRSRQQEENQEKQKNDEEKLPDGYVNPVPPERVILRVVSVPGSNNVDHPDDRDDDDNVDHPDEHPDPNNDQDDDDHDDDDHDDDDQGGGSGNQAGHKKRKATGISNQRDADDEDADDKEGGVTKYPGQPRNHWDYARAPCPECELIRDDPDQETKEIKNCFHPKAWKPPLDKQRSQEVAEDDPFQNIVTYDEKWHMKARHQIGVMRDHYIKYHAYLEKKNWPVALRLVNKKRGNPRKENGKIDEGAYKKMQRADKRKLKKEKEEEEEEEANRKPKSRAGKKSPPKQRRLYAFMGRLLYGVYGYADVPSMIDSEDDDEDDTSLFPPAVGLDADGEEQQLPTREAAESKLQLIFQESLGNRADPNLESLDQILRHLSQVRGQFDSWHLPPQAEIAEFAKQAAMQEPPMPDGLLIPEPLFKKQVKTAARRVVTCVYAAILHLDRVIVFYEGVRETRAKIPHLPSRNRVPSNVMFPVDKTSDFFDIPFRDSWAASGYDFDYDDCPFAVQMGDAINILARIALRQHPFLGFEIDFWVYFGPPFR
jgi:hypothetical protein